MELNDKANKYLEESEKIDDRIEICHLLRIQADFPEGYYGYGLCNAKGEIYHIGYAYGYRSTMSYFPKTKVSLIILENYADNDYQKDFKKHRWIRWLTRLLASS